MIRVEARRWLIVWLVLATVLVAVPVTFNLARNPRYAASVAVFPGALPAEASFREPALWRAFLDDRELQAQMGVNARARPGEYRDARIRAMENPARVQLTVEAETPARAAVLANALALQLLGASRRWLAGRVEAELTALRLRLRQARGANRRRLARRARQLRAAQTVDAAPSRRGVVGPRALPPPIRSRADELVDALPGAFPGRPSPFWAGVAGLLCAAMLWAITLVLAGLRAARR